MIDLSSTAIPSAGWNLYRVIMIVDIYISLVVVTPYSPLLTSDYVDRLGRLPEGPHCRLFST